MDGETAHISRIYLGKEILRRNQGRSWTDFQIFGPKPARHLASCCPTPLIFLANSSGRRSVTESELYDDVNDAERLSLDLVKRFHQRSNNLVADFDPAFVQQNLDTAERQRVPHIHHQREADDIR